MEKKIIKHIDVRAEHNLLVSEITLNEISETAEYAFYVFKNQERIHVEWYTKKSRFEFNTQGEPGCYRIQAFVKTNEESENSFSRYIFANPVKIRKSEFGSKRKDSLFYTLAGEKWNIPALFYPNDKKALFVLMPSAVDRKRMPLPAFNRWTWAKEGVFPGNILCISDPTLDLHDDLALGWCLGNSKSCVTKELAGFVIALAKSMDIPNDKIVIYGSSAGGFAALALSSLIDGSTAIAINAQTEAFSYSITSQVELVSKSCFSMPKESARNTFRDRLDMTARWSTVECSRVILLQNILDDHHYDVHFKPFWSSLGGEPDVEGLSASGRHLAWVYRQEGGHVPETIDMARKVIDWIGI